jgi:hypothetical protein
MRRVTLSLSLSLLAGALGAARLSCGPDVIADWRCLLAFLITFGAAAVNVLAEWAGVSV